MKFLIVTLAPLLEKEGKLYSYAPYVKEMEIWIKNTDKIGFCCPTSFSSDNLLIAPFLPGDFKIFKLPELKARDLFYPWKIINALGSLYKGMKWADHIHIRCPGNIGLLGAFMQVFFPAKKKNG